MPEPAYPSRLWQLFDYNGRLAQFCGSGNLATEPVRLITIRVGKARADEYPQVLGKVPWANGRSFATGQVTTQFGSIYVDTYEWEPVEIREPIAAPRNGKTYTWKWSSTGREWQRDYFPHCQDCRNQHDPRMYHCDWCGQPARALSKAGLCKTCGNRHED